MTDHHLGVREEGGKPSVLQATTGRLYLTGKQAAAVARIGGQCRALWNYWLGESKRRYAAEQRFFLYGEMQPALKTMRREDPAFVGLPAACGDRVLQNLDGALRASWRGAAGRKGFPRFRRKDDERDFFQITGLNTGVRAKSVRVPTVGWLRVRGLDPRVVGSRIAVVTVRQRAGHWAVSVVYEAPPRAYATADSPAVGVDLGIASVATLSDGTKVPLERFPKIAKRLRRAEREKSRRRLGSVNRRRTVERLRKLHAHLAASRSDALHKLTTDIVQRHAGVAVEALRVAALKRTHIAKSLHHASWSEWRYRLRYKAEWGGRTYSEMPAFARSTGVCPDCDFTGPRLPLSLRVWVCNHCGTAHDRDVAAAQIILRRAVPVENREPALQGRKRGAAVMRRPRASARGSGDGSPTNAGLAHAVGESP
jgi:putative transposase